MTSVIAELNELLRRERGEVEAVAELVREIRKSDPDIADGAADVLETAGWSCRGLVSRIEWLGGTPTLDAADHTEELQEREGIKEKLEFICGTQDADLQATKALLAKPILDSDTRKFLQELLQAHESTINWCKATLGEWSVTK